MEKSSLVRDPLGRPLSGPLLRDRFLLVRARGAVPVAVPVILTLVIGSPSLTPQRGHLNFPTASQDQI